MHTHTHTHTPSSNESTAELFGSLEITVHSIVLDGSGVTENTPQRHGGYIKLTIGGNAQQVKFKDEVDTENILRFNLKGAAITSDVPIEVFARKTKPAPFLATNVPLGTFLHSTKNKDVSLSANDASGKTARICISSKWSPWPTVKKHANEGTADAVETPKAAITGHPQTALALHETHRPWFLRATYYYDTTKHAYAYTTSFRVVSSLARLGESSVNVVLQKVSGKTLHDLDAQLFVPALGSLDNKVDATISTVVTKLVEGQQYVLQKKDAAVGTASSVASKSASSLSSVVGNTLSGVIKAKDYTTTKVADVSSAALSTAMSVKDYTTTQVVSVSSSTYNTAKGATVYMLSHVPYLGAKIRA